MIRLSALLHEFADLISPQGNARGELHAKVDAAVSELGGQDDAGAAGESPAPAAPVLNVAKVNPGGAAKP